MDDEQKREISRNVEANKQVRMHRISWSSSSTLPAEQSGYGQMDEHALLQNNEYQPKSVNTHHRLLDFVVNCDGRYPGTVRGEKGGKYMFFGALAMYDDVVQSQSKEIKLVILTVTLNADKDKINDHGRAHLQPDGDQ